MTEADVLPAVDPADYELPELMVVVIGNLKGGVGKTTSAFFLATFCGKVLKKRVLYIDSDPLSQTGYSWYRRLIKKNRQVPFDLVSHPSAHLVDLIEDSRADYDIIIVDVGGESPDIFRAVVPEADELVLCTGVAPSEVKRIPATFRAAKQAVRERKEADPQWTPKASRVRVLMTRVPVTMRDGANVSTEYREQRRDLEDAGYDVFDTYLSPWKWYREAGDGQVGKGAENPLEDLAEYHHVGLELFAPYRKDDTKVSA